MGGIVKSIGKAIKGIGKALKKIAPILLVAAAVYVGYGYMTGFQAGGWPKIINWGKSLMSGVTQGQTVSQAATAATDMTAIAGAETAALGAETAAAVDTAALGAADVTTTGLGAEQALTGMPIGDVGGTVAGGAEAIMGEAATQAGIDTSYWPNMIEQGTAKLDSIYSELGTGLTDAWNNLSFNPVSSAEAAGRAPPINNTALNQAAAESVMATSTADPTAAVTQASTVDAALPPQLGGPSSVELSVAETGIAAVPHGSDPGFMPKLMQLGKKAWNMYKQMWSDNPGMAMWTTSNVLKTILAMLDDSAEKESYRRRHVGGFKPGGWDEVAARYGGHLPGGQGGGRGYSEASRRSMELKPGRIPEASQSRTSAIDRKPGGIIGPSQQRTV